MRMWLMAFLLAACTGTDPGMTGDAGDGDGGGDGDGDGGVTGGDGRVIGYFAAWGVYARDYHVAEIPAAQLTHVNYAFANISADGRCTLGDPYADIDRFYEGDSWDAGALRGSFHQLQLLKEAHPHLQTLISVGGWTWSGRFSDVALTAESRAAFAGSCVDFVVQYGFDGIDIDWEFPDGGGLQGNTERDGDAERFVLLLQALRDALDARGDYLLTIAAGTGPAHIAGLDLPAVAAPLDWVNLMTYDFHGGWDQVTGFNAPLYGDDALDVDSAVQSYLDAGVPPDKIVVGMPFYGRGWSGVGPTNDGLYQPATSLPQGTYEAGMFDYHDLAANYVPTMTRHVSDTAGVPWLYDAARQLMISYDDPESLGRKCDYIDAHNLGGAMLWELSGDTADSQLLDVLSDRLLP